MNTVTGSAYYVAPQVLGGRYNHMCDMWSCGVIMYLMLCGAPPFLGDTDEEVMKKVRLGAYSFDASVWKNVSQDARVLIRGLMKIKPNERYTAEHALSNVWCKNHARYMTGTLQSTRIAHTQTAASQSSL